MLFAQEGRAQEAIKPIANGISPAAYEVSSLAEVKDEIFGPVLQIVRWGLGLRPWGAKQSVRVGQAANLDGELAKLGITALSFKK